VLRAGDRPLSRRPRPVTSRLGALLYRLYPPHRRWRSRAQTKLPACEKAKGAGQEGAPAGEAAASVNPRRPCGGEFANGPRGGCRVCRGQSHFRKRNVKLATRSAADTRQLRVERLRRDRAAAAALRVALPAVQLLHLELKFEGCTNAPTSQSHLLHPPARAFFVFPCPYADCDGQFDLNSAVHAALADPAHRAEGMLECSGARAGERATRHPCQLRLKYKVTATCQDDG